MSGIEVSLREDIVVAARKATARHFPQYADPQAASGACLYYTFFLIMEGRRHGVDIMPQAGTHFWPRMTNEQDDGVSPLFFGYQWSHNELPSKIAVMMGQLPEMHVWGASVQEIIDIQTKFLPLACKEKLGVDWLSPPPPDFVWTSDVTELPVGVRYQPNEEATKLAWKHMLEFVLPKCR